MSPCTKRARILANDVKMATEGAMIIVEVERNFSRVPVKMR